MWALYRQEDRHLKRKSLQWGICEIWQKICITMLCYFLQGQSSQNFTEERYYSTIATLQVTEKKQIQHLPQISISFMHLPQHWKVCKVLCANLPNPVVHTICMWQKSIRQQSGIASENPQGEASLIVFRAFQAKGGKNKYKKRIYFGTFKWMPR